MPPELRHRADRTHPQPQASVEHLANSGAGGEGANSGESVALEGEGTAGHTGGVGSSGTPQLHKKDGKSVCIVMYCLWTRVATDLLQPRPLSTATTVRLLLPNFSRGRCSLHCQYITLLCYPAPYPSSPQHVCSNCGQSFCGSCTVKVKRAVLGATCRSPSSLSHSFFSLALLTRFLYFSIQPLLLLRSLSECA